MIDLRRSNLQLYYKKVRKCIRPNCGKLYGIDEDQENEKNKGICPVCLNVLKSRWFKSYYLGTEEQGGNTPTSP
jgi:hypothetical protein